MVINELKSVGYGVDIIHERLVEYTGNELEWREPRISSRGGRTIAVLTHNGKVVSGVALCALEDNYCKKSGRKIALKRAMLQVPELKRLIGNLMKE
jgi:hypothetical protein